MKASEHLALCEGKRGGATAEERALCAELAACERDRDEWSDAERSVSDAYLRIRAITNAYVTGYAGEDRFYITEKAVSDLKARAKAAEERCKRLVKTIRLAYNALEAAQTEDETMKSIYSMMGDTDLGEDDSEEMKAMQAMSKIIAEEEARDE